MYISLSAYFIKLSSSTQMLLESRVHVHFFTGVLYNDTFAVQNPFSKHYIRIRVRLNHLDHSLNIPQLDFCSMYFSPANSHWRITSFSSLVLPLLFLTCQIVWKIKVKVNILCEWKDSYINGYAIHITACCFIVPICSVTEESTVIAGYDLQ